MTTPQRGSALENDIELNGVSFTWDQQPRDSRKRHARLRTVLAHEIGHALGLEDACASKHGAPLRDGCAEADTIMYAPALFEAPQQLDIARVCRKFPRSPALPLAQRANAAVAPHGVVWASVVVGALLVLIHLRGQNRGGP